WDLPYPSKGTCPFVPPFVRIWGEDEKVLTERIEGWVEPFTRTVGRPCGTVAIVSDCWSEQQENVSRPACPRNCGAGLAIELSKQPPAGAARVEGSCHWRFWGGRRRTGLPPDRPIGRDDRGRARAAPTRSPPKPPRLSRCRQRLHALHRARTLRP